MLMQEGNAEKLVRKGRAAVAGAEPGAARGVYGISVAAELVGTGVQNLRAYEARGLLEPERTQGGTRRYSADDLDRLRRIGDLLEAGLNLAGIAMVMDLQDENNQLRAEKEEQQWLPKASIPASRSPKRTSSSSRSRSTRRR
jgi:MerR family transcriptional regulator/heat shock protein HspR